MRTSPQPEQASDNLRAEKTSTKLGECLGTGPTLRKLSFHVSEIETSTASLLGTPGQSGGAKCTGNTSTKLKELNWMNVEVLNATIQRSETGG